MSKILIIGAGAVGQAYGFHLQEGGADVTFFVREKYKAELAEGLLIDCLSGKLKGSHRFSAYGVCTTIAEVASTHWDQVWLCISSPALYGDWLNPLIGAIGQASLIMLQPGMNDYAHVTALVPRERVVYGMITLASFHAPLAGEEGDPTMTWWFPPFSSAPFSGVPERTQPIIKLLKRGGRAAIADW
jgi:ketopantoate reductase